MSSESLNFNMVPDRNQRYKNGFQYYIHYRVEREIPKIKQYKNDYKQHGSIKG